MAQETVKIGQTNYVPTRHGTYVQEGTDLGVVDMLERARQTGERVRLYYGNNDTGKSWHEENGVIGTIGVSTGRVPCYLLIPNKRSMGGGAILTKSVIGIQGRWANGSRFWHCRHDDLDLGKWSIKNDLHEGQEIAHVFVDGKSHAKFIRHESAWNYVRFMRGSRWAK